MRIQITMTLPNEAASVPLTRRTVSAALEAAGVTQDCVHEVAVALTEACANVIRHAADSDDYDVVIDISDARLAVDVINSSSGFAAPRPGGATSIPEPFAEDGRGTALMHAFTDMTVFDHVTGEGSSVHLVKQLHWAPDAPLSRPDGRRRQRRTAGGRPAHHADRGEQVSAQAAEQRSRPGNQRDRIADERDRIADERDRIAGERLPITPSADGRLDADQLERWEREAAERDTAAAQRDRAAKLRDLAEEEREAAGARADPLADQRDRTADRREHQAGRRERVQDQQDREAFARILGVDTVEGLLKVLLERADLRDQRAEARDRAAEGRDRIAAARSVDTDEASADRARAARDRMLSGLERDEAAADRAELITALRTLATIYRDRSGSSRSPQLP